jgi:rubrerythrin
MKPAQYFWCEKCNKKYFSQNLDELVVIKRPRIIAKLPYLDEENKKTKKALFLPEKTTYKCKVCGMLMKEIKNDETKQSPKSS